MKTTSILLQTLCIPCGCHCRYCLLSWDNRPVGADYERSKRFAREFRAYLREKHPELQFDFAFGYCMEHPKLLEELDFLNEIGSVQGRFLQLNGMRLRSPEEAARLTDALSEHGVQAVNLTFYGTEAYHDRFAARARDFSHLLALADSALKSGLAVSAGIPLTGENVLQAEELVCLLEKRGIANISLFVPHEEGRGISLASVRFSESDYKKLGSHAAKKLNCETFRSEREWIENPGPEEQNRSLIISLTPENIEGFEKAGFEQVIRYAEELDERYYASFPTFHELCGLYGNPAGDRYYSRRDLFRHYRLRFEAEHGLRVYDVTDERFCGSRRY